MEVTFTLDKETTGTLRYAENGAKDKHQVGTLYIKKAAAAKLGNPTSVKVTITKG